MAFLTIGATTISVAADNTAARKQDTAIGQRARTFSGALRSSVRAAKRAWSFRTAPLLAADAATIRAAVALDAPVSCAGDALGGAVTCMVTVGDMAFVYDAGDGFRETLTLTLEEV